MPNQKLFCVAQRNNLYHYFCFNNEVENDNPIVWGNEKDIIQLAQIRQSPAWSAYKIVNFDDPSFPNRQLHLDRNYSPLSENDVRRLDESIPTVESLENMFGFPR